jgi:uncharacterized protein with GYD domain
MGAPYVRARRIFQALDGRTIRRRIGRLTVSEAAVGRSIRYKQHRARRARRATSQPRREELHAMPTYIMLSTLTPEGVQTVKNNPERIREVNKEVEQLGATVKAQWATLGHVDFISVVEAPDEGTMARVSLELGSRGTGRYETLAAIPVDDFIASL